MTNDLANLSKKAAEIILSMPKSSRIRIISHYDADGIASAGIICTALYEKGYDFHTTLMRNPFTKGLERLKNEENDLIIFSDMGSGQIDSIEKLGCKMFYKSMQIYVDLMATMKHVVPHLAFHLQKHLINRMKDLLHWHWLVPLGINSISEAFVDITKRF